MAGPFLISLNVFHSRGVNALVIFTGAFMGVFVGGLCRAFCGGSLNSYDQKVTHFIHGQPDAGKLFDRLPHPYKAGAVFFLYLR